MAGAGVKVLCPNPKAKSLADLNGKGRVQVYAIDLGIIFAMTIYNIHGWTDGANNKMQAERTDAMITAIMEDDKLQPEGPGARQSSMVRHRKAW